MSRTYAPGFSEWLKVEDGCCHELQRIQPAEVIERFGLTCAQVSEWRPATVLAESCKKRRREARQWTSIARSKAESRFVQL